MLQGYDKRDQRSADVVIRRDSIKSQRFLGDIGFQKTAKGYSLVVDDMDLDYRLGTRFFQASANAVSRSDCQKNGKEIGRNSR